MLHGMGLVCLSLPSCPPLLQYKSCELIAVAEAVRAVAVARGRMVVEGASAYLQERGRERGGGSCYGRGGGRDGGSDGGSYYPGHHGDRGSVYHGQNYGYAAFAEQQQPQGA
jgi:hypothetical protein